MYFFEMNETPKDIITQTGHFFIGKAPQTNIETPSRDDVSGEESSQDTSSVAGDTSINLENPDKTTSGKTAAPISSFTSTVQASNVDEDDSSFDGFIEVNYSRRGRSGRSAKENTGKNPPHPHNQVESQLPRKNRGIIETSAPSSQKSCVSPPRTNIGQSPQSVNGYSRLPENVFVVCNHFLNKNIKRPTSIKEKIKACKGCENRSKLKYAVWNDNKREYQEIRPYPERVPANVAFTLCPRFSMHVPCLRTQCSFPHGTEERLMWTLEREGGELI